jgi:uncharacterized protein YdaU (DUF1376 family)
MSFPYMPFYIGDHLRDTAHLSTEQQGAYLLLLFQYWTRGSLPDDDAQLARIAGLTPGRWRKIRPAIEGFFYDRSGGFWHHKRIEAELAKVNDKSLKRQEAAKRRWEIEAQKEAAHTDDAAP